MLLEISFIEEIKTTWGNKEVSQTFFHNFSYSRKFNLVRLALPYATLQFAILWHHKRHNFQKLSQTKKRDYQLVAVSSL